MVEIKRVTKSAISFTFMPGKKSYFYEYIYDICRMYNVYQTLGQIIHDQ